MRLRGLAQRVRFASLWSASADEEHWMGAMVYWRIGRARCGCFESACSRPPAGPGRIGDERLKPDEPDREEHGDRGVRGDSPEVVRHDLVETGEHVVPASDRPRRRRGREGPPGAGAVPLEKRPTDVYRRPPPREAPRDWASLRETGLTIDGRYRVLRTLGLGGMGRVVEVAHTQLGKRFALKALNPGVTADPETRQRFFREARALSSLRHPHIVSVTDFGVDEQVGAYLVMELLEGEQLSLRMTRPPPLGVGTSLRLVLQLAEALHYLHVRGLVHCDIKPENIFLSLETVHGRNRLEIKLIDFGLARDLVAEPAIAPSAVGGTPEYDAPEQIGDGAPEPTMDVYATGVLLFHLLTGALPFAGEGVDIMLRKNARRAPSASSLLEAPLAQRLEALLARALEIRPARRHQTMGELIFELRTVMDMLGVSHRRRAQVTPRGMVGTPAVSRHRDLRDLLGLCPVPAFVTDAEARLLAASDLFGRLVASSPDEILGLTPGQTRLGNVYADLDDDITRVAQRRAPARRRLDFREKSGASASMLVWLVPAPAGVQGGGVWGFVLALDDPAGLDV